jgi:hypothetical protein
VSRVDFSGLGHQGSLHVLVDVTEVPSDLGRLIDGVTCLILSFSSESKTSKEII